ncbi:MAG: hypothetical protein ACYS8W_01435, partial [Planctomycetota bacterium]
MKRNLKLKMTDKENITANTPVAEKQIICGFSWHTVSLEIVFLALAIFAGLARMPEALTCLAVVFLLASIHVDMVLKLTIKGEFIRATRLLSIRHYHISELVGVAFVEIRPRMKIALYFANGDEFEVVMRKYVFPTVRDRTFRILLWLSKLSSRKAEQRVRDNGKAIFKTKPILPDFLSYPITALLFLVGASLLIGKIYFFGWDAVSVGVSAMICLPLIILLILSPLFIVELMKRKSSPVSIEELSAAGIHMNDGSIIERDKLSVTLTGQNFRGMPAAAELKISWEEEGEKHDHDFKFNSGLFQALRILRSWPAENFSAKLETYSDPSSEENVPKKEV